MVNASRNRHIRTSSGKQRISQRIYRDVYSGSPSPYLLTTAEFEIIDANDAYLHATMRERGSLAGRDLFEAFPDNPELADADGVANLRVSLAAARSSGKRQNMPVQRYDVIDPRGTWRLRYWRPVNWAVFDEDKSVLALIHHVVDVTGDTLAKKAVSGDLLFKRAQLACDEAALLKKEARRSLDWMVGTMPRKRK